MAGEQSSILLERDVMKCGDSMWERACSIWVVIQKNTGANESALDLIAFRFERCEGALRESGEEERETAPRWPCSTVVTGGASLYECMFALLAMRGLPGVMRAVRRLACAADVDMFSLD